MESPSARSVSIYHINIMTTKRYTLNAKRSPESGFIALMSVIIISFVLLFAVFSIGQRGIASRFLLLDLERKIQSEELAKACVQIAIIGVANDSLYAVSAASDIEQTVDDGIFCYIHSVTPSGGQSIIETCAIVPVPAQGTPSPCSSSPGPLGATTNLRVTIDSGTGAILSSTELSNI